MSAKIENLLESFQGNAYPAMYADLAEHLGVSAESLTKLALGWVPIVKFTKKTSFCGWWAIPERDSTGEPTGLGLRNQRDDKTSFPGSKHGLIYAVNPEHQRGDKGFSGGAHNWVRTMDAGVLCPVCGKPDGCLLSAENPSDPKAVVCIRTSAGSVRPMRFGHLHIRKADGNLAGRSALADNGVPLIIVEGMSDTAAAMDLGFDAVGRPSNLAGLDELAELVRGRSPVWIIGEQDKKPDGKWPGKEGMVATFLAIAGKCRDVRMVMPPENIKDLRSWKVKYGLTREQLEEYVAKNGQAELDGAVLADDSPSTLAKSWLNQMYRFGDRYRLRHLDSTWYEYRGGKYRSRKEDWLHATIHKWSENKLVSTETAKGPVVKPFKCNLGIVANVLDAALVHSEIDEDTDIPGWINGTTGPAPVNLISFENGTLDVEAFLTGDPDFMLEPTPDYFTLFGLPHSFDPKATCPRWLQFLADVISDDPDKITLLQEWLGYNLVPDTRYHKMMVFAGPPRAGKGTITRMMRWMLGDDQVVATNLEQLTETFELSSWVNALAALDDEAFLSNKTDGIAALGVLKGITGDGFQSVNRKHREKLSLRLKTRITIATNELFELPDVMGALLPRLNLIDFKVSFVGRENFELDNELRPEAGGVVLWALEGLRRLRQQGKFTVPASSREVMERWALRNNALAGFVGECCEQDREGETSKTELFKAWNGWSDERRVKPMTMSRFFEHIKGSTPYPIVDEVYTRGAHKISVYRGIKIQEWAARQFLGKPGH